MENKNGVTEEFLVQRRNDIDCPKCGEHHVDKEIWAKRLHGQHFCEKCEHVWQPHEGYTFGE